jgi:hypothetical protein
MPRSLEALDATVKRFQQDDSSMMEVHETLLGEDFFIACCTTPLRRRLKVCRTLCASTQKALPGTGQRITLSTDDL